MKKQKKKLTAAIAAAAMTAALLSGCGTKATPENLIRDMEENAESVESTYMIIEMEIEMEDDTHNLMIGLDMNMESTMDPEASYGRGSMDIGMDGTSIGASTEIYTVKEDDEYVTYSSIDNQWTKETSSEEELMGDLDGITGSMSDYADQFELKEELVDVRGRECFELTGELDGDIFAEMMDTGLLDSLGGSGTDAESIASMTFPCTIDIYRESILPARLHLDMKDTLSSAAEASGVEVLSCYLEITFTDYNNVGAIEVPEAVINQAEEISGDDDWPLDLDDSGSDVSSAEPAEQSAELGDDWESYTVQVNDTVLTLPCTLADLEAAGVTMDREYTPEDYVINAGEYELAWFENANGAELIARMINTTDGPLEVKDCLVGGIIVDSYDLEEGGLTVIFPGGIQIGSSQDDVLAAYGDADDVYEDEEYGNTYYWYAEDSYLNGCNIETEAGTGLVQSMSLDHME